MSELAKILNDYKTKMMKKTFYELWDEVVKVARSMGWICDDDLHKMYVMKERMDKKMALDYIMGRECMKWHHGCSEELDVIYDEMNEDDMTMDEFDAAQRDPSIFYARETKCKNEIGEIKSLLGK